MRGISFDPAPPARRELKIWLAVRTDITIPAGKLAGQAGHGFVGALFKASAMNPWLVEDYKTNASPKIVVRVKSEAELDRVKREADAAGIPCHLVTDAGRTVFPEPTKTVCAFGPCYRDELPSFLRRLQLYEG